MKTKLLFTFFMLSISINIFSQNRIGEKKGNPVQPSFTYERPLNCALNTSFLMMDIKQNKDAKYLKERYNLTEINSKLYVDAFIKVSNDFDRSKTELLGVELNVKAGDFYTAIIPIEKLEDLFLINGIQKIEIGEKAKISLDNARTLTNVNQVQAGTGLPQAYTGTGVIVGVIDKGFDYTHPTFRNLATNQSRISKVWEQTETGTPPNGFSYGNEIIGQTNILNNGYDLTTESHATHVTGIAAGSGGIANSLFKGIAYNSEIVLVPSDLSPEKIFNGIQYIFNYATSVNKPAVINMSIGSHFGPHDGTSDFDLACNSIVGPGKILVGAAGNEGEDKIHVNKTLNSTNSLLSFVNFPHLTDGTINPIMSKGITQIDIWGEVGKPFSVAVNVYNIFLNSYDDFTPYINTVTNTSTYTGVIYDNDTTSPQDGCIVQIGTENSNANNSKPHAIIYIDNSYQDDVLNQLLIEVIGADGSVNAWHCGDGTAIFTDLNGITGITAGTAVGATNGNTDMTVGEIGGTGNSIISVGAFTSKNTYTDYSGNGHSITGTLYDIANFSSKGPTADGRKKPDITAPGNVIVSSVNHFDTTHNYNATNTETVSGLNDGTTAWAFATMSGTSMASPIVTGIIALWLQAKPNLTLAQIKTILQTQSITDSFTGTGSSIPNNTWGRGKINALTGVQYINQFLNLETFNSSNNFVLYPNPTSSTVLATSEEYYDNVEVYNILGQKVYMQSLGAILDNKEIDLSNLSKGTYILKFNNLEFSKSIKVIKQ